jgi:hypothetical protein
MEAEVAIMRKALWTAASALVLSLVFTLSGQLSEWFSGSVSLPLAGLIAKAASLVRWPVGEVLIVAGAPLIALLLLWSAIRRKPPRGAALMLSVAFLAYTVLWVPLCHVPAKAVEPYESWRLIKLARLMGQQADALRADAMRVEATPDAVLLQARDLISDLKLSDQSLSAPKFSHFPQILRTLKIAGLYAPWTGEAIVSPNEPDFTLPFLSAHELAHAAGVAREDEANYAAFKACMAGDARFQYAASIYALRYSMDALRGIDLDEWFEIRSELSEGVRGDFTRIDDLGDAAGGFAAFTDRAAEAFLQLSGQPAGLSSYTGVVNFLLSDVSLVDNPQTLQSEDAVQ